MGRITSHDALTPQDKGKSKPSDDDVLTPELHDDRSDFLGEGHRTRSEEEEEEEEEEDEEDEGGRSAMRPCHEFVFVVDVRYIVAMLHCCSMVTLVVRLVRPIN